MLRGRIIKLNKWQAFFSASASFSLPSGDLKQWGAQIYSHFSDTYLSTALGFSSTVLASQMTPAKTARLLIPVYGIDQTRSYSYSDSGSCELLFENIELFADTTGTWKLKIGSVKWYVDGTLEYTNSSLGVITTGLPISQPSLPIFGTPPGLTGSCNNSIIPPTLGCNSSSFGAGSTATGQIVVEGGWRFDDAGVWENFPVAWNHSDVGTNGFVSGTTTDAVTVKSSFSVSTSGYDSQYQKWNADAFMIVPNLTKELTRIESDYEALVYRSGLQGVRRWDFSDTGQVLDCTGEEVTPGTITNTYTSVYPSTSEILSNVRDSAHALENVFGYTTFSPAGVSYQRTWAARFSYGAEGTNSRFGLDQIDLTNLPPYHRFAGDQAWRSNYMAWTSPAWLMCLWFPSDDASSSVRWDLQGSDSEREYWYTIRQQYAYHPSLPSGENTKHRMNMVTDLASQNALAGVTGAAFNLPCWWGVSRFRTLNQGDWLNSVTTNTSSSSRFAFKDGGGTGSGSVTSTDITLTTGDAIEFDLSSFTAFPFMFPTVCDRIAINWTDTNISSLKCYAVGFDGTKTLIAEATGTHRIPYGNSRKWATSAAVDFGAGVLSDTYQRVKTPATSDVSSTVTGDSELVTNFGLMPTYAPVKIRFEIVRVNPAASVSIKHLVFFRAPMSGAKVYYETGRQATILFEDGPAIRFGALQFYDYVFDTPLSTPLIAGLNFAPTIGDVWAFENAFFKAQDALTGLSTRMASEFVLNEEYTIVDHLWRDPDGQLTSIGFVLNSGANPQLCYLNTYRSIPPMVMFPEKKRLTAGGWVSNSSRAQQMVSFATGKHPFIVPSLTISPQLKVGSGSNLLTNQTGVPNGWKVSSHSPVTNNDESYTHSLWWDSKEWFKVRPWRGVFSIFGQSPAYKPLSLDVDRGSIIHAAVRIESGTIRIGLASNQLSWSWSDTGISADWASLRIDRWSEEQVFVMLYEASGSVKLVRSIDKGVTWSVAEDIASGQKPMVLIGMNGVRYLYWADNDKIKGQLRDRNNVTLETTFEITSGVDEGETFAVDEDVTESGQRRVHLVCVKGGTVTHLNSSDGKTFS